MTVQPDENLQLSEDLKVGDEFRIGDVLVTVTQVLTNDSNERVLHLLIVGAVKQKYSKMMLIIPKKIPIVLEK